MVIGPDGLCLDTNSSIVFVKSLDLSKRIVLSSYSSCCLLKLKITSEANLYPHGEYDLDFSVLK